VALLDFQTALGRLVRKPAGEDPRRGLALAAGEDASLVALAETPGFRFTQDVLRSWCVGRAAKGARLTLSLLPVTERQRLLDEWVSIGGGTGSFFAAEADAFLDFIAEQLPDPSHIGTLCRVEQATLRASEGVGHFAWHEAPGGVLRVGRYSALVRFHAEPHVLLAALRGEAPLPPLSPDAIPMLFGAGLEGLCRVATEEEAALWNRLTTPTSWIVLQREGHSPETIRELLRAGAAEFLD
jgi:hypothetical protein